MVQITVQAPLCCHIQHKYSRSIMCDCFLSPEADQTMYLFRVKVPQHAHSTKDTH
uniref:Uncharacterized protein n=1 Tax=Anguilla anguilla TaxID=7936 RepID=A0A0E9TL11_ANGAN